MSEIIEDGNQMLYIAVFNHEGVYFTMTTTAIFGENGICKYAEVIVKFLNNTLAEMFYNEMLKILTDEMLKEIKDRNMLLSDVIKLEGNKVICYDKVDPDFVGYDRQHARIKMEEMRAQTKLIKL